MPLRSVESDYASAADRLWISKPGDLQWEPMTEHNVSEKPYVRLKEWIVVGEDDRPGGR